MQIRLLTLGTLRCQAGAVELSELPAQRLRCAVLVYLVVERDATREALASLLWPERGDERARHALSQKLYELRQLLGREWLETQGERMRVTPAVRVDAWEFESAAERGALEEALSLYQGEFLASFHLPGVKSFESWVDHHRARLARLHRRVRGERIEQLVASGDADGAIAHARHWVEIEPQEDEAHHRLIELLADSGRRAEALRQYDSYECALEADDLQPLDHTRELIDRVRRSSAAPEQPIGTTGGRAETDIDAPETGRPSAGALPHSTTKAQGSGYAGGVATGVLAAVLLLAAAGWWTARQDGRDTTRARSIAVLPFLNLSSDPGASDHLADGIAEELINALGRTDSLRVAARSSSFRFRSREVGIRAIGDSLNVSLVLDGSVQKEGALLRVGVQLIDAANGYQLWSESYDRDLVSATSVQEEIANAVVDALRIRLGDPERARLGARGTSNGAAYDLFLRGRHLLNQGTRPAVRSAITYLDSAVAHDSLYALAYAKLSEGYVMAASNRELPYAESLASARAAAVRAVQLAPDLSEAHAALGRTELELWNWSPAERDARLAVELDSTSSSAHALYARVLMARGRTEEAVGEAALALRLEPLSATALSNYAEALRANRNYEMAAQAHRAALELEPDLGRQNLAKVYIELAMYDSALAQFHGAFDSGAPRFSNVEILWTAYTHARAGRPEEALPRLSQFEARQPQGPNAYMVAALYVALGDETRAFQLMQLGVRERSQPAWRQLPWDPVWDSVRDDARFVELLALMDL